MSSNPEIKEGYAACTTVYFRTINNVKDIVALSAFLAFNYDNSSIVSAAEMSFCGETLQLKTIYKSPDSLIFL